MATFIALRHPVTILVSLYWTWQMWQMNFFILIISNFRGTFSEEKRLTSLNISGTYLRESSARPHSCATPQQPTINLPGRFVIKPKQLKSWVELTSILFIFIVCGVKYKKAKRVSFLLMGMDESWNISTDTCCCIVCSSEKNNEHLNGRQSISWIWRG